MTVIDDCRVSAGVDAVEARMREQYGTVRLSGADTAMRERTVIAPEFVLNRMTFTGAFEVVADVPFLSTVLSSGRYRWTLGEESGDSVTQPLLIRPGHVMHAECGDSTAVTFTFALPALEGVARDFYADDRVSVRFDSGRAISPASSALYRQLLIDTLTYLPVLADSELLRASLYRTMTAALLECFALHGDPAPRRDSPLARQDGYRRARTCIDDHAADPLTVEGIAAAASLSVPQLDEAFRAHSTTGTDTAGELRRARLAEAHRDLLVADPTAGDTVQTIALRWGFTPGNFSRAYRGVYGQTPRETLNL